MRAHEHLVLCGGAGGPRRGNPSGLNLNMQGGSRNVHLKIEDISRPLVANVPHVSADLLEVATYIYAADSASSRGGNTDAQMGARWRRNFRFVIPVRQPDLWSSNPVKSALVETVSFLSDDNYEFEFRLLEKPPPVEGYFEFSGEQAARFTPDEVILFSGGLDSFAGTVEVLVAHGKKIALVSHRSATKIASAQKHLVDQLRARVGTDRVLHIPIWASLDESLGRESTHRTRSFLFAALGSVTARLFGLDRIVFFENGVVSLNLPPVAQVVGARATRTTHPKAMAGFRAIFSELQKKQFDVINPFMWLTKAEIIERIAARGFSELLRDTRSCTRVHDMTILNPHCGKCSQCIDRRFAMIAAGQAHNDPDEAYKVNLFLDERPAGPDREMALAYVRSASDVNQMEDVAFFSRYGEMSRAVGFFAEPTSTVAERIFDLHRRHAAAICKVFDEAISTHRAALREGKLPPSCLLSLILSQRASNVDAAYPERIASVQAPMASPEIRMAIDESRPRVLFDRWGEIKGMLADLLISLAGPYREATIDERIPENYPFAKTEQLLGMLRIDSAETLRRNVLRCRNKIIRLATNAGDAPPLSDAVIESSQRHGYRLNPDTVRIVEITELTARKKVTLRPPGGHAS